MSISNENDINKQEVYKALYKKAIGYTTEESVEEYTKSQDEELVLSKKKVTQKDVPPDINALKIVLSLKTEDYAKLSDEELEKERLRLLKIIEDMKESE